MAVQSGLSRQFHERGFRLTPQRLAILQVLQDSGERLSPAQVFERVQRVVPGVTEGTVYRTLEFLAANNLAFAAHIGNGRLLYEAAGHEHHHVACRACGREVEVDHEQLIELYRQLELATGYRLNTGHLTFFGLCPDCQ